MTMLSPEECQCGKAAGGCSSRPAFFQEKIFDFLHYTTKAGDCHAGKGVKYPSLDSTKDRK